MIVGVTGGGFVGSQVCNDLLGMGHTVVCMDNFYLDQCDHLMPLFQRGNFYFEKGDILDKTKMEKIFSQCDAFIHTAGIVGAPKVSANLSYSHSVNVLGTKNVVDIANGRRIINCSTGSIYGKLKEKCTEESPRNPTSDYGIQKYEAEKIVSDYENSVSMRFATGCGVGLKYRLTLLPNTLVYLAVTEKILNIFEADAARTFIHVRDMSHALIWALHSNIKQEVFNCGDEGCNWTKRQLADYIQTKTGCYVSYNDTQKDPDQRDYVVSYDKINSAGWRAHYHMADIIDELLKACKLINIKHQYE